MNHFGKRKLSFLQTICRKMDYDLEWMTVFQVQVIQTLMMATGEPKVE